MQRAYIFTNSPGEVFSWVRPLCFRLFTDFPGVSIHVFLTPCQYATGEEYRVCKGFDGVDHVYRPKETLKMVYLSTTFQSGVVFFMGGDPMHAKRFSLKTESKLVGYFEKKLNDNAFDYLFFCTKTSNLMKSGLSPLPLTDRKGLVLLPGSRPEHLLVALPLMLDICEGIDDVTVMLSPFTTDSSYESLKITYPGCHFIRMNDPNDLAPFKYALTIPGTNTMQLAYFNIPYLMIFPTHDYRVLRMDGLLGLILMIPIIGPIFKFIVLNLFIKKSRLYSLPNQFFSKRVCKELVGRFKLSDAKDSLHILLSNQDDYLTVTNTFSQFSNSDDALDPLIEWLKNCDIS